MDIFLDVLLLGLEVLFIAWLVYAFSQKENRTAALVAVVIAGLLIADNYVGTETFEGTVDKAGGTRRASVFQPSPEIKTYQVAVYPAGGKMLRILKNNNSLWHLKFNKEPLQLQMQPGRKFIFHVYGLVFKKDILNIKPE
jgi:hypothetical protein